jgi:hypothetical protein
MCGNGGAMNDQIMIEIPPSKRDRDTLISVSVYPRIRVPWYPWYPYMPCFEEERLRGLAAAGSQPRLLEN